jgi:hypothetical protein
MFTSNVFVRKYIQKNVLLLYLQQDAHLRFPTLTIDQFVILLVR